MAGNSNPDSHHSQGGGEICHLYLIGCKTLFGGLKKYVHGMISGINFFFRFCSWLASCCKKHIVDKRTIPIGRATPVQYCTNVYRNQKYNVFTFVPMVRKQAMISLHEIAGFKFMVRKKCFKREYNGSVVSTILY